LALFGDMPNRNGSHHDLLMQIGISTHFNARGFISGSTASSPPDFEGHPLMSCLLCLL
jgi:hypothetical protein